MTPPRTRRSLAFAGAVVLTVGAACARAPVALAAEDGGSAGARADAGASARVPDLEERIRRIEEEEADVRVRHRLRVGARLSHPLRLSASVGGTWAGQPDGHACAVVCDFTGPDWTLEAGLGGARLGFGWSRSMAGLAPGGGRFSRIYLAAGGQLGLLRTWGDARLRPTGQTFVGATGAFVVTQVQFRAGIYRNVDGVDAGRRERWLYTVGVGYGF